jgi:hypothetical protein
MSIKYVIAAIAIISTLSIIGVNPIQKMYAFHDWCSEYGEEYVPDHSTDGQYWGCIHDINYLCEQDPNYIECPEPEPEYKNLGQCVSEAAKVNDKDVKKEAMQSCKLLD